MNLGLQEKGDPESPPVAGFLYSATLIMVVFYNEKLLAALF
jgi:hypothetical protein